VATTSADGTLTPVSTPATSSAARSASSTRAPTRRRIGHVAAAVVDAEPEPAGQAGQRGAGLDRGVEVAHQAADVGIAAGSAGQREATMLRTVRGWAMATGPRRRPRRPKPPIGDAANLNVAAGGEFHACEPNRVAATASASNCSAVIMPPGNRIRASAPSAALVHL